MTDPDPLTKRTRVSVLYLEIINVEKLRRLIKF